MKALVFLMLLGVLPIVASQTEGDARDALAVAQGDLDEMSALGYSTTYVDDAMREALKALEVGDYSTAIEKSREISARKERAIRIGDSLRALDLRIRDIEERGLDASLAKETRDAAAMAFARENYEEAEEFIFLSNKNLDDVEAEYSLIQSRVKAARDNLVSYVRERLLGILLALVLLTIVGVVGYNAAAFIVTKRQLTDLELEKEVLAELMKRTQEDYFKKNTIPRSTYDVRMKRYHERSIELEELIPVLRARLERLKRYDFKRLIPSG
jgi:hypothetical protein